MESKLLKGRMKKGRYDGSCLPMLGALNSPEADRKSDITAPPLQAHLSHKQIHDGTHNHTRIILPVAHSSNHIRAVIQEKNVFHVLVTPATQMHKNKVQNASKTTQN